ncbi:MAG: conjugative transfer ATPase [Gammaproteobacteria bacterium]|nr:MAG: conjugative transfer ATPase [Gammaproteobacteria bacterium]PIE37490.1 MAG: conjugative transfer ATPase [Gammaproteobacteria bacterium]
MNAPAVDTAAPARRGDITIDDTTDTGESAGREARKGDSPERDRPVPRTAAPVGRLGALLRKLLPSLDKQPESLERWPIRHRISLTDEIPWVEYLDDERQFAFADNKSVMAVYDLTPVPTEGRSIPLLRRIVQDLVPIVSDVIPEHSRDPWVMGLYGSFDARIDQAIDRMEEYASPLAKGSRYTEDYIRRMREHYTDVVRKGGYFHDDMVSDTNWGGRMQRARLVIYRRYARSKPDMDSSEELDTVCNKLENSFRTLRVKAERLDGREFYRWMRDWLNPRPALCDGDPRRLDEVAPYPGDIGDDEDLPFSADLGEMVTLSAPFIDDEHGIWYLDGMPHVVLQTESVQAPPRPGAMTGEIERDEKRYTTIDELPDGTVIALNVIFRPREETIGNIEKVRDSARGDSESARATRLEAQDIVAHAEETGEPLYPCELAFYLRADNLQRLHEAVAEANTTLLRTGIRVYDPFMQKDPVRVGNFIRNLPGLYQASIDEKAARRARLIHANHIMRLAPIFGRSRGTGNPGISLFNRSGEPLFFDLLSSRDSQLNGHTFIYGRSGSGKSAINVAMLDSLIAMHRPRIFIIDLGNSFGPLVEHATAMGLSTHIARFTMSDDVSIPPFADAVSLVDQEVDADELAGEEAFAEDMETFERGDTVTSPQDDEPTETGGDRDVLGELEIIARLMIRGGGGGDVKSATLRISIQRAIKMAAERAVRGELATGFPRPEDVARALSDIGRLPENQSREAQIEELANAMLIFCGGLNGHVFNRDGAALPEVDLTVLDVADAGQSGREETLIVGVVALVMHVNRLAERDQYKGRPILFLVDEAHLITAEQLLMTLMIKITKMWRKLGARLWLSTQEVADVPVDVKRMIGMMEFWIGMSVPKQEIELTRSFRPLTDEQASMMAQCRTNKGKYSEGCIMARDTVIQFRSVPPSLTLALSQTEPHEKAARFALMQEKGISEFDAIQRIAEDIRRKRLSGGPTTTRQRLRRVRV